MTDSNPASVPAAAPLPARNPAPALSSWTSPSGLRVELHPHGALHRLSLGDVAVNLFVGNALEGGPAQLVLRRHTAEGVETTPLLGPRSPTRWNIEAGRRADAGADADADADSVASRFEGAGRWQGLAYRIALRLAADEPAWFWHLRIENTGDASVRVDLLMLQDLALSGYSGVRQNEYYVSQYLDHTPLAHSAHGTVLATRQNQGLAQHPWCVLGSLNRTVAWATDASQVHGLAARAGRPSPGVVEGLPSARLQHEHAMSALQDAPCDLAPGASADLGFFGCVRADHPDASSAADLALVDATLGLPEARPPAWRDDAVPAAAASAATNLFVGAPTLQAIELDAAALERCFGAERRHVERDAEGRVQSFFIGESSHVALRAKELAVLRPHGMVMRTGRLLVPDESALTSTVWMGGVFHSMLTQGHVATNRCLSAVRSYLGLFRSQGLRVFVEPEDGAGWQLLDQPSAFEMSPDACRWVYAHAGGRIEVRSRGHGAPHAFGLDIDVIDGPAVRCLVCLHLAFDGDDGSKAGAARHERDGDAVRFAPAPESELGRRFPGGHWRIEPFGTIARERNGTLARQRSRATPQDRDGTAPQDRDGMIAQQRDGTIAQEGDGTTARERPATTVPERRDETAFERVGGDEALFSDGVSRDLPYLTLVTRPARSLSLMLLGRFVTSGVDVPAPDGPAAAPARLTVPLSAGVRTLGVADAPTPRRDGARAALVHGDRLARLLAWLPWLRQNALVHYLSPRGLEQFTGGGWGTRDVCQGPLEMLLAQGHTAAMRELLLRTMAAQRTDGDWPQWFMFFARDAGIRADDSHGDIAFWPLLALAQYLIASGDTALLDEAVPFHPTRPGRPGRPHTVWQHVLRALALTRRRVIPGTALAAYGHGDWNDALQPADPSMRETMCSAWTVTLHHQMLTTLATALHRAGRAPAAARLEREAEAVRRDFTRLLLADDVLAGYALFGDVDFDDGASGEEGEGIDARTAKPRGTQTRPDDRREIDVATVQYLLHPRDDSTGAHYSLLAMAHAIIQGLFDETQMRHHLKLIDEHLTGPDGARLFDRPFPYRGGSQRHFQRAESASFFGREIGLMYTHAHLRFAQALAHVGEAERFFHALCQANPIGLAEIVPGAAPRPSNNYYSSSDARFADRYRARDDYGELLGGRVALEGGWRVYSSGAGILLGLVTRQLFGLRLEAEALLVDPVLPAALDGLEVQATLMEQPLTIRYRVQGQGCGVDTLTIDGRALAFTEEPNPYRRGAARVPLNDLLTALEAARDQKTLTIEVGGPAR